MEPQSRDITRCGCVWHVIFRFPPPPRICVCADAGKCKIWADLQDIVCFVGDVAVYELPWRGMDWLHRVRLLG